MALYFWFFWEFIYFKCPCRILISFTWKLQRRLQLVIVWWYKYLFWVWTGRLQTKKKKKGRKIDWNENVHGQKNHVSACAWYITSQGTSVKEKTSQGPVMKWAKGRKGTCVRTDLQKRELSESEHCAGCQLLGRILTQQQQHCLRRSHHTLASSSQWPS